MNGEDSGTPGTVLGGRYALRRRITQGAAHECWSAHDTTLEREVALTIVDSRHPNRAGVMDAARRAAGVEDTRLVRILDVGAQDGRSYIVEETMSGSESLAAILALGPLPAEEARRIAGETARGLETASQRGLHHLRLTPHCVLIAPDGAIRVSGTAVAAAIDRPGEQEPDPAFASRRDALCVVAVTYAALTSRWPLDEPVPGIQPAPRVAGGVAIPSEIVAEVPGDLDALCHTTLNEGAGPPTPGDFASQIAPWSRERVQRNGVEPTAVLRLPGSHEATDDVSVGAARTEPPSEKSSQTAVDTVDEPMTLHRAFSHQFDDLQPPLPMLPASTAQAPSRGQSIIVVIVVAAFVGLALVFAAYGLRPPSGTSAADKPVPQRTVATRAPAAGVPAAPAPQGGATAGGPIAILSATGFDPEGDRSERDDLAARVYDDDTETTWTSESYGSVEFGNLKKGAGVILNLGQPTSVHEVSLDLGSEPLDVTVYAATEPSLEGATKIRSASEVSGQIQLKPAKALPEAQYIIVWFTKLAKDGSQFRASISEIALR